MRVRTLAARDGAHQNSRMGQLSHSPFVQAFAVVVAGVDRSSRVVLDRLSKVLVGLIDVAGSPRQLQTPRQRMVVVWKSIF